MHIPKETIELIRERCHIEEIIQRYVPSLKKKGKNYLGLCPFHKEKTPSFTVTEDKQIFYCFGCHTGGNVFTFISKIERLDFPQSVKFVADIVGIEIKDEGRNDEHRIFDEMIRINTYAMNLYNKFILSAAGKEGRDYITARGIKPEYIDTFKLGFAPDSWNFLLNGLNKKKASLKLAEQSGLISASQKNAGQYFDRFRKRIIFPIFDINNRVVAFGGRVIDNSNPKYLNSQESELFKKRNILYGMHTARDHIREMNRAIIVEGYLDVLGCHQEGIKNVVAPLGTALTENQVRMLSRHCGEIILLFDADSAGINAALKSLQIEDDVTVDIRIATLPEGDPFEFIQKKGVREFMAVVDKAQKPVDFRISRIMTVAQKQGPVKTLMQLFSAISSLNMESERSIYLKNISSMMKIDENAVRRDFLKYTKEGNSTITSSVDNKTSKSSETENFLTRGYRDLIKLLCFYPELIDKAYIDFSEDEITDAVSRKIYNKIMELHHAESGFSIDKLFDFFVNGIEMDFLNRIVHDDFSLEDPKSAYSEIYLSMKLYDIDGKIDKYVELIRSNHPSLNEYLTEVEILRREKEKLSHYIYNKGKTLQ